MRRRSKAQALYQTGLAERIIDAARSWKGSPYQHQGRLKNIGVDCVNFVTEVAKEAGVGELEIPHDYKRNEDGIIMLRLLNDHMEMVEEMQPGDVLALCDRALQEPNVPRHLVFVTEVTPRTVFIIHASEHGVREHRIDASWRKTIHSIWRIK